LTDWWSHEIPELDARGLRKFGLVTAGMIAGLFGAFFPWWLNAASPGWPWWTSAVLSLWALIAPASLRVVYRVWMRLGLLLNRLTTPVIMGLAFFVVVTPMGLIMRGVGRDPLARRFEAGAKTYRIMSGKGPKHDMERPF